MQLKEYLSLSPEVAEAIDAGRPVVALESTIISHGMPYPQNVETALACEKICRDNGAVPATCAIIGGKLCAGLTPEQIDYLGRAGSQVAKASRRDIPMLLSRKMDGATTVAATMIIAHLAGIQVFATGGIGGVHRGFEQTMDVSADLEELAQTPYAWYAPEPRPFWICPGPWSIWKPRAYPLSATVPMSSLPSIRQKAASPCCGGQTAPKILPEPSGPARLSATGAACW